MVRALARFGAAVKTMQQLGTEPVRGGLDNVDALRNGMFHCDVVLSHERRWNRKCVAATRETGVKRFVHVSTEAVLAGGPPIHNADETWLRAKNPLGLYPLTKGLFEERMLAANASNFTIV